MKDLILEILSALCIVCMVVAIYKNVYDIATLLGICALICRGYIDDK